MNAQSRTVQFRLVFDLIPYLSFHEIFEIRFLLNLLASTSRLQNEAIQTGPFLLT